VTLARIVTNITHKDTLKNPQRNSCRQLATDEECLAANKELFTYKDSSTDEEHLSTDEESLSADEEHLATDKEPSTDEDCLATDKECSATDKKHLAMDKECLATDKEPSADDELFADKEPAFEAICR